VLKVLTAQYFIWYLALLPLVAIRVRPGRHNGHSVLAAALALGSWAVCLLFWLATAYRLEFLGHDAWGTLWPASLAFYVASMAGVAVVVRAFDDGSRPTEVSTAGDVALTSPVSGCTSREIKCTKEGN
jgi:phosphatidylinositol glycan class M